MRVSIIVPTYKREHLLQWGLTSLAKQTFDFDFETIILNDGVHDNTESLCNTFKEQLNIKYIFTGKRNLGGKMLWRVPGFALNVGVKQSTGDILIFCCAEMFHLNDTIKYLIQPYDTPGSDKVMAIPRAKDDNGKFLAHLNKNVGNFDRPLYDTQPPLVNVKYPFLLAVKRKEFMVIGGYDEDFTGTDYDDSDLVDRLVVNGCHHVETEAETIHLWHPRLSMTPERIPRFKHNEALYYKRQGIIHRNLNREWGVL